MKKRDPFKGLLTGSELGLQREKRDTADGDDVPADAPDFEEDAEGTSEERRTRSRDDE
jgi:hypothetical protein